MSLAIYILLGNYVVVFYIYLGQPSIYCLRPWLPIFLTVSLPLHYYQLLSSHLSFPVMESAQKQNVTIAQPQAAMEMSTSSAAFFPVASYGG
jgi:hypothetical protein